MLSLSPTSPCAEELSFSLERTHQASLSSRTRNLRPDRERLERLVPSLVSSIFLTSASSCEPLLFYANSCTYRL